MHQKVNVVVLSLLVTFCLPASLLAVSGTDLEYHGYFRAGSGSSSDGNDQTCYTQSGIPGNEFRLGNECAIYGEATLLAHHHSPQIGAANFDSKVTFAYNPPAYTQYENAQLYLIEAYVMAGNLGELPGKYWVGKRFYRDVNLQMNDFYYFAEMSGNGAGVEDLAVGLGKARLAVAVLTEAQNVTGSPFHPRTAFLDVRLSNVELTNNDNLFFWAGAATSTYAGSGGDPYGAALGVKYTHQMSPTNFNRLAVVWGEGRMEGLFLGGPLGAYGTNFGLPPAPKGAQRVRAIEDATWTLSKHFGFEAGAIYERWNMAVDGGEGEWLSVGARPIFFFTDHLNLALEAGGSRVRLPGGNPTTLTRLTVAPQIMPWRDPLARPVLRAFATETFSQGMSWGFQGEVWF